MHKIAYLRIAALAAGAALLTLLGAALAPSPAAACGCFAQSNPATPVVQGGERIAFAMKDGQVTAHIQIQYAGAAEDFAWLVPLPSMPEMELGVDELFTELIAQTQPQYSMNTSTPSCPSRPRSGGGRGQAPDAGAAWPSPDEPHLVLEEGSVGPYDYTVLSAEDKQTLADWLAEEGYFVATGGDQALDPYIRPGGFFLALKLRTGESVGNLQPIVLRYQAELPQIPIVLTSVGAERDMPVMVWMLGEHRAIPRNYYHTHINDALIDWRLGGANYVEVVTAAVDEADGQHSFVTEYAGTSDIMRDRLDAPGRFGDLDQLAGIDDPMAFLRYLRREQYLVTPQLLNILEAAIPLPEGLEEALGYELDYSTFYLDLRSYTRYAPELFEDAYPDFDPRELAATLDERIVTPTLAAGQLFRDHPYMTRLFTTLSPEEMTKDPVFSFNPNLPDVSNIHTAELRYLECREGGGTDFDGAALLTTEQGWRLFLPRGLNNFDWPSAPLPASHRIEILREEGQAEVMIDNTGAIEAAVSDYRPVPDPLPSPSTGGCDAGGGAGGGGAALALALWGLLSLRRRRQRSA
ncbi:MAG: hypothetical protein Tsb0020_33140 [Haliangiales bacterium]